jgi:hypothetical protein
MGWTSKFPYFHLFGLLGVWETGRLERGECGQASSQTNKQPFDLFANLTSIFPTTQLYGFMAVCPAGLFYLQMDGCLVEMAGEHNAGGLEGWHTE